MSFCSFRDNVTTEKMKCSDTTMQTTKQAVNFALEFGWSELASYPTISVLSGQFVWLSPSEVQKVPDKYWRYLRDDRQVVATRRRVNRRWRLESFLVNWIEQRSKSTARCGVSVCVCVCVCVHGFESVCVWARIVCLCEHCERERECVCVFLTRREICMLLSGVCLCDWERVCVCVSLSLSVCVCGGLKPVRIFTNLDMDQWN